MVKITVQIFENGYALGEGIATVKEASTEQEAVDIMFKHMRVDRQFRFLGHNGFIIPTGKADDYMLFNGGKA
jgi:hypothetical protein